MRMLARHYICSQSLSQDRQLAFGRTSVDKLEQAQAFVVRDGDHRAKGRFDSFGEQSCLRLRCRGRLTKNFRERFAKTALRFKTAAVTRFIRATAFSHLAQSKPTPARAM